jgi:FtsZ-binding cell division protein ZapB
LKDINASGSLFREIKDSVFKLSFPKKNIELYNLNVDRDAIQQKYNELEKEYNLLRNEHNILQNAYNELLGKKDE